MLREEGERIKDIIRDIKPSAVGDLAISIDSHLRDLIDELSESKDETLRTRAQHIRALTRELHYGEEYDGAFLCEPEAPEGYEFATGVPVKQQTFNFPAVSGVLPPNSFSMPMPIVASGVVNPQPIPPSVNQNPCGEVKLPDSEMPPLLTEDELDEEIKQLQEELERQKERIAQDEAIARAERVKKIDNSWWATR